MNSNNVFSPIRYLTTTTRSCSGLCGPAVRLLMQHYGLTEKDVKASGPKGNVLKSDVADVIKASNLKPIAAATPSHEPITSQKDVMKHSTQKTKEKFVDIPLSNIRATIARRLTQSKQSIPHAYLSAVVYADAVLNLQAKLLNDGIKVSLNDFIIKAAGLALRAVPDVNVQYSAETQQVIYMPMVDISVAVATPNGLITPIVTSADILSVQDISVRVKELAARARDNKLMPNEFQGGSFTVSNLGMFGSVDQFTAIINPPQSAILAVGGNRVELDKDLKTRNRFRSEHFLADVTLKKRGVDKVSVNNLKDKVLLLYFSAGWCGSCKMLTPKLKKFYEELGETERSNMEVVWISRDKTAQDQLDYYEKAMPPWCYIPIGDPNIQGFLEKYSVKVIPALKLVNDKGEVLSETVRADVEGCVKNDAMRCYKKWKDMY
ncbi:2-oxo acid dehydrogenase acyltransferase [Dictyocaulus viviparus]|uniref:2-oxo acid dehydrogenase acyltransferase n=1 Tax=Dictyocaulus viviparus TaxID=29172 RepID=A0A0D8Y4U8_DICVI|nr:2-oxo acid dehydrogenase acyltransferase [Dictyocaulus viviparus]